MNRWGNVILADSQTAGIFLRNRLPVDLVQKSVYSSNLKNKPSIGFRINRFKKISCSEPRDVILLLVEWSLALQGDGAIFYLEKH